MGKPRLMDRARDAIRSRHYSIRIEQCYLDWIKRFILFHGKKHPADMGEVEITAFLTNLAVEKHVAASTQNQALSAILYMYKHVLSRELAWMGDIVRGTLGAGLASKHPAGTPTAHPNDSAVV